MSAEMMRKRYPSSAAPQQPPYPSHPSPALDRSRGSQRSLGYEGGAPAVSHPTYERQRSLTRPSPDRSSLPPPPPPPEQSYARERDEERMSFNGNQTWPDNPNGSSLDRLSYRQSVPQSPSMQQRNVAVEQSAQQYSDGYGRMRNGQHAPSSSYSPRYEAEYSGPENFQRQKLQQQQQQQQQRQHPSSPYLQRHNYPDQQHEQSPKQYGYQDSRNTGWSEHGEAENLQYSVGDIPQEGWDQEDMFAHQQQQQQQKGDSLRRQQSPGRPDPRQQGWPDNDSVGYPQGRESQERDAIQQQQQQLSLQRAKSQKGWEESGTYGRSEGRKGTQSTSSSQAPRPQPQGWDVRDASVDGWFPTREQGSTLEAAQIVDVLRKQVVYLTGGRDRRGGPLLVFPKEGKFNEVLPQDVTSCLTYLASYALSQSTNHGFTVILDNRKGAYKNIKDVCNVIRQSMEGMVHALYVVQNEKQKFNLSIRRDKNVYGFEPKNMVVSHLQDFIEPSQLIDELGGLMLYNHTEWVENRVATEKYIKEVHVVVADLEQAYSQIAERLRKDDNITPQELLTQHRYLQERVIHIPERVAQQGRELHSQLQAESENVFLRVKDAEYTLDQVKAMDQVREAVLYIESKLVRIQDLWRTREGELGKKMQLSELETAMKTVVDWILGPAEKLLASQTDIGDTYKTADELRKQHEQLELKCTDTYGTYAELRHKALQVINDKNDKAPDIEAQRDFMDMVCRSYAARLERRRNLVITSVRFHRLAEELSQMMADLLEFLRSDAAVGDADSAKEALKQLADRCSDINGQAEQTFNEGQNLLDQLSLPIKNGFGQDVSPDNRRHVSHVQRLMESLQDRKVHADELADMRKLKLQQIQQLRACERDADQAIHWLLELCQVTAQTQTQTQDDPDGEQQQQQDQKKVQATAMTSYEYGKQLLQTALQLRRSLHIELEPNHQQSRQLNDAWKKFSQGLNETTSRMNDVSMFNKSANGLLVRLDDMLVVLSQVINMEMTVEHLVLNYTVSRDQLSHEVDDTLQTGDELVLRLSRPILTRDSGGKQKTVDNQGLADGVQSMCNTIQHKMSQIQAFWVDQVKGIQLGSDGQLLGSDGRPIPKDPKHSKYPTSPVVETNTKTSSHLVGSAPPGGFSRHDSEARWQTIEKQLIEVCT